MHITHQSAEVPLANIQVPKAYGYVMLVGVSSLFLAFQLGGRVMEARKKYGVKYPTFYATKDDVKDPLHAHEFNAVQRAHGNFLENYPQFLMLLFISGLSTPELSAGAGLVFLVGRYLYAVGYTGTNPEGRYKGAIQYVALIYLLLGSIYTSVKTLGVL